jgi:hypothetical protein
VSTHKPTKTTPTASLRLHLLFIVSTLLLVSLIANVSLALFAHSVMSLDAAPHTCSAPGTASPTDRQWSNEIEEEVTEDELFQNSYGTLPRPPTESRVLEVENQGDFPARNEETEAVGPSTWRSGGRRTPVRSKHKLYDRGEAREDYGGDY